MNIALFSDSWFPTKSGIVTVVSQLFDCLEKKGHHVVLVTVSSSYEADNEKENIFKVSSIPLGLGTDQNYGFPILSHFLRKSKTGNFASKVFLFRCCSCLFPENPVY